MLTIGIDSVEIERFQEWTRFSYKQLLRIFSKEELEYAFSLETKKLERLAVRFAAKEAFYKALTPRVGNPLPFLRVCNSCSIVSSVKGIPTLKISWETLGLKNMVIAQASFTHTQTTATAIVILVDKTDPL